MEASIEITVLKKNYLQHGIAKSRADRIQLGREVTDKLYRLIQLRGCLTPACLLAVCLQGWLDGLYWDSYKLASMIERLPKK